MRISDLSSDVCSSDLATGGDVTLGTDDSGVISVESGAAIDVGAHRPGDRLVRMERNGETFYSRSEEHTSELQSLMRISYAVFCLKKKNNDYENTRMYTSP